MNQPFLWLAAAFTAGILAARIAVIPDSAFLTSFLAGFPVLWAVRGRRFFLPVCLILTAALGALAMREAGRRPAGAVENYAADPMAGTVSGQWTELQGRVAGEPEIRERGRRRILSFVLAAEQLRQDEGRGSAAQFAQIGGAVQVFAFNPDDLPQIGDQVRLRGRLERPRPALNPGEFNYPAYLAQKQIFALFNAYGRGSIRVLKPGPAWSPPRWIEMMRRRLAARMERLYGAGSDGAVFFKALILGTARQIPSSVREEFVKTGTAHTVTAASRKIFGSSFPGCLTTASIP